MSAWSAVWRRAGEQTGATPQSSPVALTLAERLNPESALFLLCRFSSLTTGNRFSMLKQARSLGNPGAAATCVRDGELGIFKLGLD